MDRTRKRRTDSSQQPALSGAGHDGGALSEAAGRISSDEIVAGLPDALIVLGRDGRITYANPAAERVSRRTLEQLVGRSLEEAWPEPAAHGHHELLSAMNERAPAQFEYLDPFGVWLDIYAYPCGEGIGIRCRDIGDRKHIEEELRRRQKELTDFIENAPVPLHWVGADGTILWANDAELKLLGYSRDEYVGHKIMEFHVDPPVIADILDRLRNRQELDSCEARVRARDGSIRYVALTSNVYWEDGRFVHTRCFTRDITEQKRTAELRQRLASIVESSDDAIISKDLNGIVRSWNRGAERIFGYTAEEMIGQPISVLAAPETANEMPRIIERIRNGDRVDHYETRRRTKDGRVLAISLTVSPIRDASGVIVGASKIARDITERVRSEQMLRDANAALVRANSDLEQFAYSASHDLQEPLRMIATYSAMLKRKFEGQLGADGDQYIRYLIDGALRMQQLIRDLLAYTQASTMTEEPAADADAGEALAAALANLHETLRASGASVTSTQLPSVRMHRFQLEQIFQNLISNAVRFRREEPPQIHVAAERQEREWLFSVRDNGIGIEPRYQERIFGMFKRLHTAAEYPGTGMGLAICQRIVHRAGGRMWVESEAGQGATFFFTAPASREG